MSDIEFNCGEFAVIKPPESLCMSDSTCTQNLIFLCAPKERVTKTLVLGARRPASARGARAMLKKGFGRSSLIRIRQFYLAYPKDATLSHLLSWSRIVELLKIDDPLERRWKEHLKEMGVPS